MIENEFKINYHRHEGQREVIKQILSARDAVIFTIVCARGWGKTLFATNDLVIPKMLDIKNCQVMWVAPTYRIARAPVDDVWFGIDENTGLNFIPQYTPTGFKLFEYKKHDSELHLFNNSKIFFRSASNPESIVSKGFNIIVIDEAALILKDIFMKQILPTARRKGVQIFIITTPRGKNWVYEMYMSGQNLSKPMYLSFKQPWWKRPDYPKVLQELMKDIPEYLRKQEFDAEFIGEGGSVFRNLTGVFEEKEIQFPSQEQEWESCPTEKEFNEDTFVVAVDFAKEVDYTVIAVMSTQSRKLHHYHRFNKTSYKVVIERIRRIAEVYNADVIFDSTGVGAGLADFMERITNAYPFKFTNQSKNELINRLIVSCEYGEVHLPNIVTIREEFELFTYSLTRTGKLSYHAPEGKHDDTVIAIALANWYAEENVTRSNIGEINTFLDIVEKSTGPKTQLQRLIEEDD